MSGTILPLSLHALMAWTGIMTFLTYTSIDYELFQLTQKLKQFEDTAGYKFDDVKSRTLAKQITDTVAIWLCIPGSSGFRYRLEYELSSLTSFVVSFRFWRQLMGQRKITGRKPFFLPHL
jgi:hypothetical protein